MTHLSAAFVLFIYYQKYFEDLYIVVVFIIREDKQLFSGESAIYLTLIEIQSRAHLIIFPPPQRGGYDLKKGRVSEPQAANRNPFSSMQQIIRHFPARGSKLAHTSEN